MKGNLFGKTLARSLHDEVLMKSETVAINKIGSFSFDRTT